MSENNVAPGVRFCQYCGVQVLPEAVVCVKCGCALQTPRATSGKSRIAYGLFYMFLWPLGVHEFYAGKSGKGLLWLFGSILSLFVVFPIFILSIWAFIASIIWLTKSDEDFDKYVNS
jgi:TM2 domain-containing membrane protein YozV